MSQLASVGYSALCAVLVSYGIQAGDMSTAEAPGGSAAPDASGSSVQGSPASPAFTVAPLAEAAPIAPLASPLDPPADLPVPADPAPPPPADLPIPADPPPPADLPVPADPAPPPADVAAPSDSALLMSASSADLPPPAAAPPNLAPLPVFAYDVIGERRLDRPDKANTYYVVIPPVDAGQDQFKAVVRSVLRALAAANGGPQFTAHIWDLRSAAETELSYAVKPDAFSDELFQAKHVANEKHFVASYTGGVVYAGQPPENLIYWFPDAAFTTPDVGRWMGAEVWDPV